MQLHLHAVGGDQRRDEVVGAEPLANGGARACEETIEGRNETGALKIACGAADTHVEAVAHRFLLVAPRFFGAHVGGARVHQLHLAAHGELGVVDDFLRDSAATE